MSLLLLLPVRNFEEIRKRKNRGQGTGKTTRVSETLHVGINEEKSTDLELLVNLIKMSRHCMWRLCISFFLSLFFFYDSEGPVESNDAHSEKQ